MVQSQETNSKTKHTRVFINEIPNSDTSASINLHASRDNIVVVKSLLSEATRSSLSGDVDKSDVKLGDVDIKVKSDESVHLFHELRNGRRSTNFKVRFETNTVDLDTTVLQVAKNPEGTGTTRTSSLNTIIVVDELDGSLGLLDGLLGSLEGNGEESRANNLVEGVSSVPASSSVKGLVDYIP